MDRSTPDDVLNFWITDLGPGKWYKKDPAIDQAIREKYLPAWEQAKNGSLESWPLTANGALALIIVLDQFPRNMFRNNPKAFSTDPQARAAARAMLESKFDLEITGPERQFCYMPFMHSERLKDQTLCVDLMRERLSDGNNLYHAQKHREVIEKFGRFPHRNDALNRQSTAEEIAYLASGGYTA